MLKAIPRIISKLKPKYQQLNVFEQSISISFENEKPDIAVDVRPFKTYEEIEDLVAQREKWYPSWVRKQFSGGNICFGAIYDGKIVCCLWTSFDQVHLPNVEYVLKVDRDTIPLIDGWTASEYRGKGIYKHVWSECLRYFRRDGKYQKVWGFIRPTNERSLSVHEKMELSKVIMTIFLVKVFGIRFHKIRYPTM